jgi:hypothetical protein
MTNSENNDKLEDHRLLTSKEHDILRGSMNALVVFTLIADIILISIAIGFAVAPDYPEWAKDYSILGMSIIAISISAVVLWDWKNMKKDNDSGIAERVRGVVSHKWITIKGGWHYIIVDKKIYEVLRVYWLQINLGDEIIIEWVPRSKIIFNIMRVKS